MAAGLQRRRVCPGREYCCCCCCCVQFWSTRTTKRNKWRSQRRRQHPPRDSRFPSCTARTEPRDTERPFRCTTRPATCSTRIEGTIAEHTTCTNTKVRQLPGMDPLPKRTQQKHSHPTSPPLPVSQIQIQPAGKSTTRQVFGWKVLVRAVSNNAPKRTTRPRLPLWIERPSWKARERPRIPMSLSGSRRSFSCRNNFLPPNCRFE